MSTQDSGLQNLGPRGPGHKTQERGPQNAGIKI